MAVVADGHPSSRTSLLFAGIVAAFCAWILSLPLFPSQDGPMHRYYVHVLGAVLSGSHLYDVYQIRHPFPPYLTHYFTLLLLSKFLSFDLAEKVFVCGLVACFAYGFRFCARALGDFGDVVSLCIAPLFLQWSVMMGFLNYALAVALFLFAAGCWIRAMQGRRLYWVGFAAITALLTVTHPVPLLVLIGLLGVDLLLHVFRSGEKGPFLQRIGWRVAALFYAGLGFVLISGTVDRSQSASALQNLGFHLPFVTTAALLTGVSPYNTRSTSLLINSYRLSLYALLVGGLIFGARRFSVAWRLRQFTLGDSLYLSAVVLALGLPFIPENVNGSAYFATRLVALVWIGALLGAAGYVPRNPGLAKALIAAALVFASVTLITAQVYVRPVARSVHAIEEQPLPRGVRGLILLGPGLDSQVRFTTQFAPDPFAWATVLPFVSHDDVALDSPWLDQAILPLAASPGSPLLIEDIRLAHLSKTDPPSAPGRSLPGSKEKQIVRATDFIVVAGTPQDLSAGLSVQLDADQAARFHCTAHDWYLVCLSHASPDTRRIPNDRAKTAETP